MLVIGITGGIGSGKTTASKIFQEQFKQKRLKIACFNSDYVAKDLLSSNQAIRDSIRAKMPEVLDEKRNIDRQKLADEVFKNKEKLSFIENLIHPKIAEIRKCFLDENKEKDIILLDIPLLFEKGIDSLCNIVVAVRADIEVREQRVIKKVNYTTQRFHQINANQLTDQERIKKATYFITNNSNSLLDLEESIQKVILQIYEKYFEEK